MLRGRYGDQSHVCRAQACLYWQKYLKPWRYHRKWKKKTLTMIQGRLKGTIRKKQMRMMQTTTRNGNYKYKHLDKETAERCDKIAFGSQRRSKNVRVPWSLHLIDWPCRFVRWRCLGTPRVFHQRPRSFDESFPRFLLIESRTFQVSTQIRLFISCYIERKDKMIQSRRRGENTDTTDEKRMDLIN